MYLRKMYDTCFETKEQYNKNFVQIGSAVFSFFHDLAPQFGYAIREGQWELACEIVDAMQSKKHIIAEASVGIGKTFAYLVPILLYHRVYNRPIVIATSTIALQDQMVGDLEKVIEILKYPEPEVLVAKGQTHFLCKDRFENFFWSKKTKEEYMQIYKAVDKWGYERSDWTVNIPDRIWENINVKEYNPLYCKDKCPHKSDCHYNNLRHMLTKTNGIIICNQDLLAAALKRYHSYERDLFNPNFSVVVIDEAHNLETKFRNSVTTELTLREISSVIERSRAGILTYGTGFEEKVQQFYKLGNAVFRELEKQILNQNKANQGYSDIENYYVKCNSPIFKQFHDVVSSIDFLVSSQFGADEKRHIKDMEYELEKLEGYEDFFKSLIQGEKSEDIFWMNQVKQGVDGIVVKKCPKAVNQIIHNLLFNSSDFSTILTSATITSGCEKNFQRGYDYFIQNTGFPEGHFIVEPKASPFNYDDHALVYYTNNMPHPSNERELFIEKGAKVVEELLDVSQGKALILFTAKRDMEDIFVKLCETNHSYDILMQKPGISQNDLVREFKNNIDSVLLGTGTFWEGINVEGISLSQLIIFKLPFPVPEPIIDYKTSIVDDGLLEVLVPEMIIKLKQGIGRLIRSETDKGIVSIIDSRIGDSSKAKYKNQIWESLPIKNRTNDIEIVKEFYQSFVRI